jgi:plastocyanin
MDRISIDPGTTITFVNDDDTSHRLVSGIGNSNLLNGKICSELPDDIPEGFSYIPEGSEGRDCDFIFDGRINTGEIASGDSITITFDDRGFYRLLDPDYPWMRIDGYVFSNLSDNLVIGEGQNLGN